jgi:acetyl-CoA C-acetyltransferase
MSIFVLEAIRIPRGKGNAKGALHHVKPVDLLKNLFDEMRNRTAIDPSRVDEVILGCVGQLNDQGGNIAHTAALYSDWQTRGSGTTLTSYCTSGITACSMAAAKLLSGQGELYVVGGVESMSRVPILSDNGPLFTDPDVSSKVPFVPNGVIADFIAARQGYSREDLDAYASASHNKAALATENGYFKRSLVPVRDARGEILLSDDELIRPGSSIQSMAKLSPSFENIGAEGFDDMLCKQFPEVSHIPHHHHAGNSPGMVDGASLALLATREMASNLGIPARAEIIGFSTKRAAAIEGLTGGYAAAEDVLKRTGLNGTDIDLWEFNEGFAATAMNFAQQLHVPPDRYNVNGSGIAMGHAMGATGVNILSMMIDELERRKMRTGLIAISGAAGAGAAMIVRIY